MHTGHSALLLSLVAIAATSGCGGGGGGTAPPSTTAISKASTASGDAQNGTVGQPLASRIQVVVTENGSPSSGTTVTWSTTGGGALDPASGATDPNGVASSAWTLGNGSGAQTARAALSGATGSPVTFTANASPGAASTLAKAGGDNQTGEVNAKLASAVEARVSDQFGNGVPGVNVAWAGTGGSVSASSVPTDGSGVSPVDVTVGGSVGPIIITATSDGLTGSPLTFNGTAVAPVPVPATAAVTVGNIFFRSNRNATSNPAVDTIAVSGTVTWTWVNTSSTPHSVQSNGSPSFTSSALKTGSGQTYTFTFPTAGAYVYTCAEHPGQMTGRIVVR